MPCSADTGAFLYDDEVVALIALDEVDCHAHALAMLAQHLKLSVMILTRDTCSDDDNCSISVVFIPDRNLWPWLRASHLYQGDSREGLRWREVCSN